MKLTPFLVIALLLQASLSGDAQTVTFSGKDVPLKKIFATIKTQTGTLFFYDEALMKESKPVTVQLRNVTLQQALDAIFKDQPLTWVLEDKTVTISKKPVQITNPPAVLPHPIFTLVKGIITDEQGGPIAGVSVMVKGTKQGVVADSNGRFFIKARQNDILQFSSVSYGTKEVKVEREEINVQLQADVKPLEEVLVGGNISALKRKEDATSVTVIDAKTLEKQPQNTIDNIYRGLVPGTNSFNVGDAPEGLLTLSIRGAAGSSSVAEVDVYIDGIEYAGGSGYLSQLDKTNIDRIEIVRGPGASTMYGTGSNAGIVQIFTKKPKLNQTAVSFMTSAGFYKSKWVEKDPFQQVHNLEVSTGFKKVALTLGGSYRTLGAYLPDGGEINKGFYLDAGFNLGKLQVNVTGRYNVRNYSESRNPRFDTAIHPRADILLELSPGDTIPAYEYFGVRPTPSLHTNALTETYIAGVNLSHHTFRNWVNRLQAGYTANDAGEIPAWDGAPLRRVYSAVKINTTTVRYSNTLTLGNHNNDFGAEMLSGLEYKKYVYSYKFIWSQTGSVYETGEPDNENYGAFAQLNPSYRNVHLTLGLRYEKNELFTAALNPKVGLTTNFNVRSWILKPRISWGKGITAPSYTDRFGEPASDLTVVYPNPHIKPQSQQGFDYGLEVYDRKGKYKFEIVYYDNILKDMIDLIELDRDSTTNPPLYAYISVNGAQIVNRGWEFSGEYATKRFSVQAVFSIINSTVEDTTGSYLIGLLKGVAPGTRLSNLPKHIAGLNFTYSFFKLFGKNDQGSVSLNISEVDGVKSIDHTTWYLDIAYGRTSYNGTWAPYDVETPAVFRVGLYAEYQLVPNLRFFTQGYNILNDYHYENSNVYPTHGATWLFGFKYDFVKNSQAQ